MLFILTMVWRETRSAWRHFIYFFLSIALGVAALVAIGVFSATVERTVAREARSLMGGDLELRLSRPIGEAGRHTVEALEARGIEVSHLTELAGMAAVPGGGVSQIVELKAVDDRYPLYGHVHTDPPGRLSALLTANGRGGHGAIVQESLLIKLGLSVGERLAIGTATFQVTGVLRHEPDRVATAFSLGPRVLIARDGLEAAGLVRPGSRVRERYVLRLPAGMATDPLLYELRAALAGDSARVSTYRDAQPQLRGFLDQLTRYLGLVGLTALFIGGLGVSSSMQAFIRDKWHAIAVLKTLGADSATIIGTYLIQALGLALVASAAGAWLGVALQNVLATVLAGVIPPELVQGANAMPASVLRPVLTGMSLGVLTTVLFVLWPLLAIRLIRPAGIFRHDVADMAPVDEEPRSGLHRPWRRIWLAWRTDRLRLALAGLIVVALAGLAMLQARSWLLGSLFIGGLLAAALALRLTAWLLVRMIAARAAPRSVAVRYALGNVRRPGSQAVGIIVSVGIGVMIIVAVALLERSLVQHIGDSRPVDAPAFFFIDIQPDQADAFAELVRSRVSGEGPNLTPLVRSRLHSLNGRRVALEDTSREPDGEQRSHEGERERKQSWYFTREYVLTFLDTLPKDNRIVRGQWWRPGERSPMALVSVEEEAAHHLGVEVGSTIEFDIQGTPLPARVSSIRSVDWSNFSTNFYMILSPGSLEGVPFTYVATVRVPPAQEVALQQAVVAAFPNVTAINIGEVMDNFARILEHLSLAIRAVAVFCILSGAVVMAAALATTRYRRLYESVVLKALGATRGIIARAFAMEYALMGAVAGLIGIGLASALSAAVLHYVFDLSWRLHPQILAFGLGLTILLTLLVGFFSTFRILGQKPLAILRHE